MANDLDKIDNDHGPAMMNCRPKERTFVLARIEGHSIADSARIAGYGNPESTPNTMARIGNRLVNTQRVVDALVEVARKAVRSAAPDAVKVIREIMADKMHPKRLAASMAVLDRVDPQIQKVDVTHHQVVDHDAEAVTQLRALKALGVAQDKLIEVFGQFGLHRLEQKMLAEDVAKKPPIDVEFTELPADPDGLDDLPDIGI